jgi:very-short-patch-repair endonuclease
MPGGPNIASPGSPTAPMGAPDMGGMPGLAPAASSDWEANYRFASAMSGDMYDLQLSTCKNEKIIRTASRKILSAAHKEYIESIAPVTGRGVVGALDMEPGDIVEQLPVGPNDGGPFCTAMNRHAIYELTQFDKALSEKSMVRTGAKKGETRQTYRFTSLEQKLYKILMQAGLPFAWYAQYLAGPITQHFEYQLDAAIPALKLGLEADGEIYHSNPEKIAKDRKRDSLLATQGWTILRFTENELNEHPEEILKVIMQMIRRLMGSGGHVGSTVIL